MSNCGKCLKQIVRSAKDKICCKVCNVYFHGHCVNLTQTDIDTLVDKSNIWVCATCNKKKRLSRSYSDSYPVNNLTSPESTMPVTLETLKPILDEMKKEILDGQVKIEKQLGNSINQCFEQLDESNKFIKALQLKIGQQ